MESWIRHRQNSSLRKICPGYSRLCKIALTASNCSGCFGHKVGYYLRAGDHDITQENWDALLNFIRKNFDI